MFFLFFFIFAFFVRLSTRTWSIWVAKLLRAPHRLVNSWPGNSGIEIQSRRRCIEDKKMHRNVKEACHERRPNVSTKCVTTCRQPVFPWLTLSAISRRSCTATRSGYWISAKISSANMWSSIHEAWGMNVPNAYCKETQSLTCKRTQLRSSGCFQMNLVMQMMSIKLKHSMLQTLERSWWLCLCNPSISHFTWLTPLKAWTVLWGTSCKWPENQQKCKECLRSRGTLPGPHKFQVDFRQLTQWTWSKNLSWSNWAALGLETAGYLSPVLSIQDTPTSLDPRWWPPSVERLAGARPRLWGFFLRLLRLRLRLFRSSSFLHSRRSFHSKLPGLPAGGDGFGHLPSSYCQLEINGFPHEPFSSYCII